VVVPSAAAMAVPDVVDALADGIAVALDFGDEVVAEPRLFKGRRSHVANAEPEQDLYETPTWDVEKMAIFILKKMGKLPSTTRVWEPCAGNGRISATLTEMGYGVVASGLFTLEEKRDFLTGPRGGVGHHRVQPAHQFKNAFILRAIELGKPWLFLLPLDTLTSKGRNDIFINNGVQVWVENTPMTFTHDGEEVSASKGLVWIGGGWAEGHTLEFLPYGKVVVEGE